MGKTDNGKYPPVAGIGHNDHVGMVREIFATIPGRYDLLNRVLSLRRDVAWRRLAVRGMRFFNTFRFLDVATGTADLAIEAARRHPGIQIEGIDFAPQMLALGHQKIRDRGLEGRIRLFRADAMKIPFANGSFDAAGIAFGIRNMPDRLEALQEVRRVLAPGGSVHILEMSAPQNRIVRGLFAPYLKRALPRAARLFSRNPAAYLYLVDSILHFPPPAAFMQMLRDAGFEALECRPLTLGITHLYIGRRPWKGLPVAEGKR